MQVGWLIDGEMFGHYRDKLVECVHAQGHNVQLTNNPQPPYRWDDLKRTYRDLFPQGACVIAHGDIELISRIHHEGIWTPGAFATVSNFYCSSYYGHFGAYLLNRDYIMLPFAELRRCREFLMRAVGQDGKIFVRPDSPLKIFTGQVAKSESFEADLEFMAFYEFPPESLVVVSRPREITSEWRFVVVDRQVVTGCQYSKNGAQDIQPGYDDRALELAARIAANEYQPDPAWVMDICQTSDGEFHLLEIGGFSFADLYACEMPKVVEAVSAAAIAMWQQRNS